MSTATESTDPNGIATAIWSVAIVGAIMTAAAPVLLGPTSRLSVALGALLGVANLWAIARTVRGFLHPAGARSPWVSLAMLKFAVMFLGVLFLVRGGYAQLLPLVIGYAAMPVGIVISQLKSAASTSGEG
jgi:ATP synthase I chain